MNENQYRVTYIKKAHIRHNFTKEEDEKLKILVNQYGESNWNIISSMMVSRNIRQCRERWFKYLSPNVCTDKWTNEEDALLIQKRYEIGPKWKVIATFFHGRTDINIKSRFNLLKRKAERFKLIIQYHEASTINRSNVIKNENYPQRTTNNLCQMNEEYNQFDEFDDSYNIDYFDSFEPIEFF